MRMNGIWYSAVGAAFVLGLLFIQAYGRRGRANPADRQAQDTPRAQPHGVQPESAGSDADRRRATAEADALLRSAETDAEAMRRSAESDAAAARRAAQSELDSARAEAESVRARAAATAESAVAAGRREGAATAARLSAELDRIRGELQTQSRQLDERESAADADTARLAAQTAEMERATQLLERGRQDLADGEAELIRRQGELTERAAQLDAAAADRERELERVAGLTAEQAKAELMSAVESGARREAAQLVRVIENEARAEGTQRAREIVVEAVQRVASEQTAESVVSVLHLPGDDMKGRIIGREGRNIRAFESVTGVNVIIDDTPEAVLLSCFDPVRREIGRLTLDKLVLDGRIHPHRIEEAYEQSKQEVEQLCLRAARDALADVGVHDLDERLIPILGRLKYRTSYGQNVLAHLIETAHIAGVMAAELGVEPTLVKRCAFLHDIGKALTHEVEGSHAIVGAELLRKYGELEAVAHAVEAHHNEVQPRTVEAVLTQASDTCSAARPGARRESLENYVKRLARIEQIAAAKHGVEKVFAMQSGREVRVMVQPGAVDDLEAQVIAREIAKQIEDELTYPGQIRVTVVRESRATEIAH
jgi:ribonuclease Y